MKKRCFFSSFFLFLFLTEMLSGTVGSCLWLWNWDKLRSSTFCRRCRCRSEDVLNETRITCNAICSNRFTINLMQTLHVHLCLIQRCSPIFGTSPYFLCSLQAGSRQRSFHCSLHCQLLHKFIWPQSLPPAKWPSRSSSIFILWVCLFLLLLLLFFYLGETQRGRQGSKLQELS